VVVVLVALSLVLVPTQRAPNALCVARSATGLVRVPRPPIATATDASTAAKMAIGPRTVPVLLAMTGAVIGNGIVTMDAIDMMIDVTAVHLSETDATLPVPTRLPLLLIEVRLLLRTPRATILPCPETCLLVVLALGRLCRRVTEIARRRRLVPPMTPIGIPCRPTATLCLLRTRLACLFPLRSRPTLLAILTTRLGLVILTLLPRRRPIARARLLVAPPAPLAIVPRRPTPAGRCLLPGHRTQVVFLPLDIKQDTQGKPIRNHMCVGKANEKRRKIEKSVQLQVLIYSSYWLVVCKLLNAKQCGSAMMIVATGLWPTKQNKKNKEPAPFFVYFRRWQACWGSLKVLS